MVVVGALGRRIQADSVDADLRIGAVGVVGALAGGANALVTDLGLFAGGVVGALGDGVRAGALDADLRFGATGVIGALGNRSWVGSLTGATEGYALLTTGAFEIDALEAVGAVGIAEAVAPTVADSGIRCEVQAEGSVLFAVRVDVAGFAESRLWSVGGPRYAPLLFADFVVRAVAIVGTFGSYNGLSEVHAVVLAFGVPIFPTSPGIAVDVDDVPALGFVVVALLLYKDAAGIQCGKKKTQGRGM